MNRTHLERAAEALAEKRGYAFFVQQDETLQPNTVKSYPAAVIKPLSLAEIEQRGRATYDMTLRLLRGAAKKSPEQRRAELATLEEDLLDIFAELSEDQRVLAVEKLSLKPNTLNITPHGEIAQTASARIITWF